MRRLGVALGLAVVAALAQRALVGHTLTGARRPPARAELDPPRQSTPLVPVSNRWSARRTLTRPVAAGMTLTVLSIIASVVAWPQASIAALVAVATGGFLLTTGLRLFYYASGWRASMERSRAPAPPARGDLPLYTVMVAMYHEANVVEALFAALNRLEYPKDRLQVLVMVEHDDPETAGECRRLARPGWEVVVVEPGTPKTKPRALNAGLSLAQGELLTIYDAEDRPDPDQLLKAVNAFHAAGPDVAALQARLDFYNADQTLLTRLFACEYAVHFGVYLDGLARCRHPIPLGGTSTHFRTSAVRDVGGWDAWNVTEDCELGMRLAATGRGVATLDSTTWEEAVPVAGRWIRQRSRWVKGFAQTALAMVRHPFAGAAAMGVRSYASALVSVAGVPVILAIQPAFWAALWLYAGLRTAGADVGWLEAAYPEPFLSLAMVSLLVGNFAIVLAYIAVLYQQSRFGLVRYALLVPAYHLLASIGAWKGLIQLALRPHHWEKTEHGLSVEGAPAGAPSPPLAIEPPYVIGLPSHRAPATYSVARGAAERLR